jgi:hypothetical protein
MRDRDSNHRNGKPFARDEAGRPFAGKPFGPGKPRAGKSLPGPWRGPQADAGAAS